MKAGRRTTPLKPAQLPNTTIEMHLGHRVDFRSEAIAGRGVRPGFIRWEETYQADRIRLARPHSGAAQVDVLCRACGHPVTVLVRSQQIILRHYLLVAIVVAVVAWLCYQIYEKPVALVGGALVGLFFCTVSEFVGQSDHHSASVIVKDIETGHRLFKPEELSP